MCHLCYSACSQESATILILVSFPLNLSFHASHLIYILPDALLINVCSKWVMMNEDTRRLQKVSDDVRDEYLVYCPRELRLVPFLPSELNFELPL